MATVSQGLVLGLQTHVPVSKTGLSHGTGCWHPSPPWWQLSLPWVMTSYKEKNARRLVHQHHKRKLCPQSRFGRKRWMCAVLSCDRCKGSPMGHWLGQRQLQWAKSKSRLGHGLTEQEPWQSSSATWCRGDLYGKLRFLTPGHLPWRQTDSSPPIPDYVLEYSWGPQRPPQWAPYVLVGLCLRSSKR